MKNTVSQSRTLAVLVTAHSVHYNGVEARLIKLARGQFTLQPKESQCIETIYNYINDCIFSCA